MSTLVIRVCPTCGSNAIRRVRRNWKSASGVGAVVPNLEYYECGKCGERVYNREAMRRIEDSRPTTGKLRRA
jgi:YgiT-type zinc finger domain-containing protein